MSKKYKILLLIITILLVGTIIIGTSYSLWSTTNVQEGTNEINVGCFKITFSNVNSYGGVNAGDINLINAYPISEEVGSSQAPYMFSIKNECSIASNYIVNLETLNESNFNIEYLRVKFNDVNNVVNTTSQKYSEMTEGNIILTEESSCAKKLISGYLAPGEITTYSLRVWIDNEATVETENVMGKTWKGKVVVTSEATETIPHEPTAAETIMSLANEADSTSTEVIGTTNLAYDGTADNNLRYVGSNPNNYVSFNNELWRIIGVMNNIETESGATKSLVKIQRAESLGNYSWDTTTSDINSGNGINEWGASGTYEGADLMRELNYDYLGDVQVGTDGKWFSNSNNSKTADMPTSTISSTSQAMIESVVWNLGSPSNDNGSYDSNWANTTSGVTAPISYTREKSNTNGKICTSGSYCNDTVTRTSSWTGKVGLFYPSDYLYATSGGTTTNRNTCLTTPMSSWNDSAKTDCKNNDWLYDSNNYQWTMLPNADSSIANYVFFVYTNGNVSRTSVNGASGVSPVVFLKSTVSITGGEGSQDNPYLLN